MSFAIGAAGGQQFIQADIHQPAGDAREQDARDLWCKAAQLIQPP